MRKLQKLLQEFFKRTKKESTLSWYEKVDKWISEDYPEDNY